MNRRDFFRLTAAGAFTRYLPAVKAAQAAPNIVLVVADDLAVNDVVGNAMLPTPNLDALAANGATFTDFYSAAPVCSPARFGLLTGQHLGRTPHQRNWVPFEPSDVLLTDYLKAAGYATATCGKWGNGQHGHGNEPTDYFDYSYGFVNHKHAHESFPDHLMENGRYAWFHENRYDNVHFAPGHIAQKAINYVATANEPFFLFAPVTLPHANNELGEMQVPNNYPFENRDWPEVEKRYASAVWRLDWMVGQLVAKLEQRGILGNTLILFTADNGPHSDAGHDPNFFNGNSFRGQKGLLYEGGIRVPLIAHWPTKINAGRVIEQPAWFPDLFATLTAVAGASASSDGIDLTPWLDGSKTTKEVRRLYWRFERQGVLWEAARFGGWKGVRRDGGALELYNLVVDEVEQDDVAMERPDMVAAIGNFMASSA